jgi:hypothetical protein
MTKPLKLKAPPFKNISLSFEEGELVKFDAAEKKLFLKIWPQSWPAYRAVLEELFSDYHHANLLKSGRARLLAERLKPTKTNRRAHLLLRFSFDDSGITWDIFQKGGTIVHAQPVF